MRGAAQGGPESSQTTTGNPRGHHRSAPGGEEETGQGGARLPAARRRPGTTSPSWRRRPCTERAAHGTWVARVPATGRGAEGRMDVKAFTIDIPQATLDDLHQRLSQTRWSDPFGD